MDRIPQLDGIRGIAILLVLVWHYFKEQVHPTETAFLAHLKLATNITWSGVDLFFVLSGFLIGGILIDHRAGSKYFQTFYARRVLRIFPLYFLVVAAYFPCATLATDSFAWLFADPLPSWSYLTFTQNYQMSNTDFGAHWLGVTWSVAIEEQFYLLLPLLVRFMTDPWLVAVLLSFIVSAPLMRSVVGAEGSYVYGFCRADSLFVGVLLAWLYRQAGFVGMLQRYRSICWSIFLVMALLTSFAPMIAYGLGGVLNHLWLAIHYGVFLLLVMCFRESWLAQIVANRLLIWLGVRSYCIYLVHQVMSGLLHGFFFAAPPRMSNVYEVGVTGTALVSTLILADLSFRYFEEPFLRFGRRFRYIPARSTVDRCTVP